MRQTVALVGLAGLLMGCSTQEPAAVPASTPTPTTSQITAPTTAPPTDAAVPPELPEQAATPPPATAGPLSARNLPAAADLGWKTFNDPGGHEAGFLGNNTWTRRREAHQAAFEALPVGCAGSLPTKSLPVPLHALQGSYKTGTGKAATVLLLRFKEAEHASAYFAGYQARMKSCGNGGDLSVEPLWSEQTSAAAIRQYTGAEHYTEVAIVDAATVALLAAEAGPQTRPWTTATAEHLRRSLTD